MFTKSHPCSNANLPKSRWLLYMLALACLVGSSPAALCAQDQGSNLGAIGIPSYTGMIPVESGFIKTANGALHLEIPLGTFPQRGGHQFTAALIYDSNIWGAGGPINIPAANDTIDRSLGGWRLVTSADPGATTNTSKDGPNCSLDGTTEWTTYQAFVWYAPDGTSHGFDFSVKETNPTRCTSAGGTSGGSYALDSSGYYMSAVYNANAEWYDFTVRAPDGTQVYPRVEDSNGNYYLSALVDNHSFGETFYGGGFPAGTVTDSLGRTLLTVSISCPSGPPYDSCTTIYIDVLNSQGTTSRYTVTTQQIPINASFPPGGGTFTGHSITGIQSVQLPDNTSYSFKYDCDSGSGNPACGSPSGQYYYGELTSMNLPTGGQIKYSYASLVYNGNYVNRAITSRTTPDSATPWGYAIQWDPTTCTTVTFSVITPGCLQSFTVTKPTSDKDVYTMTANGGAWPTTAQFYTGASTLLATINQSFNFSTPCPGSIVPACKSGTAIYVTKSSQATTLYSPSAVTQTTKYAWDSELWSGSYNVSLYGNLLTESEWNFGSNTSNPADRTTTTAYLNGASYLSASANILNRPTNIKITNSAGTTLAQTNYCYDYANGCGGSSFTSVTGASNHDDTNYGAGNTVRGDATQVSRWLNTTGGWLPTNYAYDTLGNQIQIKDPNLNTTSISYTDNFYNYTPSKPTYAYPTTTTKPTTNGINHIEKSQYYFGSGLPSAKCGENFQSACAYGLAPQQPDYISYSYDTMNRLAAQSLGDGGQKTFSYNNQSGGFLYNLEQDKIDGSRSTAVYTMFDGLGRQSRWAKANDESQPYDQEDTCYDVNGRVNFQSYPYQNSGFSSSKVCSVAGDTFYPYDGLDRLLKLTHSDGSAVTISYQGRAKCVTDEGNGTRGVERCSQIDGFGNVISVCEITGTALLGTGGTPSACNQDSGGTGFLTTYSYDLLGNLTSVSQGGYLNRTFNYDSLSRLTSAQNPESSTTGYTYDNNGNVLTRTRPAPNQTNPAVTVTTTYGPYDALNRLTKRVYSDGVTPGVHFVYDTSPQLGVALLNPIGRLTEAYTDANNGVVYGYDPMGRVIVNNQAPPLVWGTTNWTLNYSYDFLGDVTSSMNGWDVTPFTLSYSYNRAGRLTGMTSSFSDSNHPATLFSGAHYNAAGSFASATLDGGVINESRSYDSRLRLNGIGDSAIGTTFFSLSVPTNGYAPNSNMLNVTDTVTNSQQNWSEQRTWTYTYDDFNRLITANETDNLAGPAAYSYAYDRFGNRWQQNGPNSMMLTFSGNNNQIDAANGVSYDAAGNVIGYHPPAGDTFSYAYDAENRLKSVTDQTTGNQTCYTYDAFGRRVERTYN
jgi:YD repeat-containing protein